MNAQTAMSRTAIRDDLATVPAIAGFDLDKAATRIDLFQADRRAAKAVEIVSYLKTLPADEFAAIVREAGNAFSGSYGIDQIDAGLDRLVSDFRDEQENGR